MLPASQAAHVNFNITQEYTASLIAKGRLLNLNRNRLREDMGYWYPSCNCVVAFVAYILDEHMLANFFTATQVHNNVLNNSSGIASCLLLENQLKHSLIVEILWLALSGSNHTLLTGESCKLEKNVGKNHGQ